MIYAHPLILRLHELNITFTLIRGVQIGDFHSVLLFFSTVFPKNRYQKIAVFWELCRTFCKKTAMFYKFRVNKSYFSVLHKTFTAFSYRIRAPPSEV